MSTISKLFPDIGCDEFLEKHFRAQVPISYQGDLSRLEAPDLPGADSFEELLTSTAVMSTATAANAMLRDKDGRPQPIRVAQGQALPLFRAGITVFFENVQIPAVTRLSAALLAETGFPPSCGANGIFMGLKGTGVDWHCDTKDIFVIQLSGAKRWQFAPNTEAGNAVENVRIDTSVPGWRSFGPEGRTEEVLLRPGAVLFLPRNWWHRTMAVEEPCMGLTLGIRRPSYLVLLLSAIHCLLADFADWRAPTGAVAGNAADVASTLDSLRARARQLSQRLETLDGAELLKAATDTPAFRRRYRLAAGLGIERQRVGDAHEFRFSIRDTVAELRCGPDLAEIAELVLDQSGDFTAAQIAERVGGVSAEQVQAIVGHLQRLGAVEDRYTKEGVRFANLPAFQSMLMAP